MLSQPPAFISLYDYMAQSNATYYGTHGSIGASGDFITAPEISQMFGELLGAWVIARWQQMGKPKPFNLVEMGPGKGTLMADMLRLMRGHEDIYRAIEVHLVETSPRLRAAQTEKLSAFALPFTWHARLENVPDAPFILIANEFLDALPIRQFIYTIEGWKERGVTPTADGYAWTECAAPPPTLPPQLPAPIPGNIFEACPDMRVVLQEIARRAKTHQGSALFIDYGYARTDYGDTFQAVSQHEFADPLGAAGEQDLTAHVNFAEVENFARAAGLQVSGPTGQGEFLMNIGLQLRADKLIEKTETPVDKLEIIEAAHRLTSPSEMGTLFKVICLSSPNLPMPEGFYAP